ncbi:uncharacterized protein LOC128300411 [Anopheles moucheti]|uniref:uncharacterized protein LOC128300411 n=1 Tax=Anopheles moucheti TaxID=186751 RepID=UPI0022F10538|nr:uncharacterized protein LOC128300411 [Anopheles moucheti]
MQSENLSNMVNLSSLLLKYNNFSKVENDIFLYIDRILENAFEIHKKHAEANKELAALDDQIAVKQKYLHKVVTSHNSESPAKKRKVQSLDSSLSACKENVSILEDSTFFPHKSDSDVSSKLEQNIIDSDEPFFALTQTPPSPGPPVREALSPRNDACSKPSTARTKLLFGEEIKSPKKIIRESKLANRLNAVEASSGYRVKPIVPSTVTPTSTGKWTGKKGKLESPSSVEHTPTGLKRFYSLTDGKQRFRQAKLNFPRQNNHSPGNEPDQTVNDTLFSDFVVPTPPSVANKSKMLRSLRMKKQSSMISRGHGDRSAAKESSLTTASATTGDDCKRDLSQEEDINQTYCSGVESIHHTVKDLSVNIKQEPDSQKAKQPPAFKRTDLATNQQRIRNEDSESNEIILIRTPSQQSIITVVESQHENDEFITELHNEQANRMREPAGKGMNSILCNNVQRTTHDFGGGPSGGNNPLYKHNLEPLREVLCNDCMKLYKFYTARGISNDAALSKLTRNCRGCRTAQLHHTPPGFWDPDFLPTPQ